MLSKNSLCLYNYGVWVAATLPVKFMKMSEIYNFLSILSCEPDEIVNTDTAYNLLCAGTPRSVRLSYGRR